MSFKRVRIGDWLAGGWGLAAFLVLWLDWYSGPVGGTTGWEAFAVVDLIVAVAALSCAALPLVTAANAAPRWPVANIVIAAAFTVIALLFVLFRLFFEPGPDRQVAIDAGGYLGFICLGGAFLACFLAMRDERSPGVRQPGPFPVRPAPPA
jgi:hypothetical protein